MMGSNVFLSDQIFDTVFLSKYFAGENFRFFDKDGRKDVMITHFDRLVQKEPVNTASLADAFIAIGRVVTSDGTTNVDLRVNLESGEREKNSIDYEVLERVLGAKLTLRDPIDLAHYFPIPTKNSKGNHFYYCALTGTTGKRQALAKVGPFATLSFLSISADGVKG
jgi:hypothetical protein